jgi:hypothetical protein
VKKIVFFILFILFLVLVNDSFAQCSICTKTAQQLGDKPAKGLNLSILFLAFTPLILIAFIGWRWWRGNKGKLI